MKIYPIGLIVALSASALAQNQKLHVGDVLTKSGKIAAGTYALAAPGDESGKGALVIRGDNLTIDFQGATLSGSPQTTDPDKRKGVGVEVRGKNVTIKNLKVRGYKIGLMARNSPGLKVLDSDLSYNWKQHLLSTQEREDGADWMSYHQNEKDEWLRYGAAIYLRDCDGFEVRNTKVTGGQNALMITECDRGLIWNNDFSYNSSLALGMYRSSDNRVMHNRMDWNVRGFSYGVYNRGQDSAGILIYEQSHRNTFAYNSVTHSGDGFFLWAGQTTMDSGKGGCNDNFLYGNDFSHAPTNGIEATFSRNTFANNLILECWHGVWGGYSYDTKIVGNVFGFNTEGIAIEHGQNNTVSGNLFYRDDTAIHLWMNERQDPNWGYAKTRDTKSHGWVIAGNTFKEISQLVYRIKASSDVTIGANNYGLVKTLYDVRGPLTDFRIAQRVLKATDPSGAKVTMETGPFHMPRLGTGFSREYEGSSIAGGTIVDQLPAAAALTNGKLADDPKEYAGRFDTNWNPLKARVGQVISVGNQPQGKNLGAIPAPVLAMAPKPLKGGIDPFLSASALRGWKYMIVDQWGPYDFKRPLLWPRGEAGGMRRFEILGPTGSWKLTKLSGVDRISARSGSVPGFVDIDLPVGKAGLTEIELTYVGGATVDARGVETPAGKPVKFGYSRFFAPIDWTVKFYRWSVQVDPKNGQSNPEATAFAEALKGEPIKVVKTDRLDYASGGAFMAGLPNDQFATVADGSFEVPAGDYVLELTTDDGAKVYVDGKLVIADAWKYQGPTPYEANLKLAAGKHTIRIEHFEINGYAALKLNLRPR